MYNYIETTNKTILDRIKFFKSETDVIDYLENEKLELIEEKELVKKGNIHDLKRLIINYLSGMDVNLSKKVKDLNIELSIEEKWWANYRLSKFLYEEIIQVLNKYGMLFPEQTKGYSNVEMKSV